LPPEALVFRAILFCAINENQGGPVAKQQGLAANEIAVAISGADPADLIMREAGEN
jgi:hypothetical protein